MNDKAKRAIVILHRSGEWKGVELARIFGCSAGRVSQIVNAHYGEHSRLGLEEE